MKIRARLKAFFLPPQGSPRWRFILPYAVLGVLSLIVLVGGAYGWEYTNSPAFCGYTCHTMPPQNVTYLISPHANVYCTECHIGRAFVGEQLSRKTEDVYELISMTFHLYEYPIRASRSRPAMLTCEKCHKPETFVDDSLRVIQRYAPDRLNTPTSIYLVMKTGGGSKREGLGRGIHWHIVNQVQYYAIDPLGQQIPYVVVTNDDGSRTEYLDVESDLDPSTIDPASLKTMDCVTCHNRVSHNFMPPSESVDLAMSRGLISPEIPFIRKRAVDVLSASYESREQAMRAIAALETYYRDNLPQYYAGHGAVIRAAVAELQAIYDRTVFPDQKVDWTTHPNNLGHMDAPGCFRCHDGKHLDARQQAIRLECNLCHSIPVVAGAQDFVARIEISRGPEPESHRNANWIVLHRSAFDATCSNCHTVGDMGGVSNTSFCSNSACHGNVYTYAGFDAPALREILQAQLPAPAPAPQPVPVTGTPTYEANIAALMSSRCGACHGETNASAGLTLTTYAGLMRGGKNGKVVLAGDSAGSRLVQVQSGTHFARFNADELDVVRRWIDAGAPER